jgi:ribosomal protein L32E
VDDREPLKEGVLLKNVKNNMKNSLMSIADKICLRKRALIETANEELKILLK